MKDPNTIQLITDNLGHNAYVWMVIFVMGKVWNRIKELNFYLYRQVRVKVMQNQDQSNRYNVKDMQLLKSIAIIFALFIICSLPTTLMNADIQEKLNQRDIILYIIPSNFKLNPIIYLFKKGFLSKSPKSHKTDRIAVRVQTAL